MIKEKNIKCVLKEEKSHFLSEEINYDDIHNFISTKGLNTIFPAFSLLNYLESIDLVEYKRQYEAQMLNKTIYLTFEEIDENTWLWKTYVGNLVYKCRLKNNRYSELIDRIHLKINI